MISTEIVWPSAFHEVQKFCTADLSFKTNRMHLSMIQMYDPIQFKSIHSFNLTNVPKIYQKSSDSRFKPVNKNVRMENFRSCHNYLIQLNLALWSLINTSNTFQYLSFTDNNIIEMRLPDEPFLPNSTWVSKESTTTHSILLNMKGQLFISKNDALVELIL